MSDTPAIAVTKRFAVDGYAYPSVRLRVSTDAGEPVAVRLVESLPPGVDLTAVGFHADEGYEHWSVTGAGEIVYEDVIRDGDPSSTLYGIAETDPGELRDWLDAPTVEVAVADDLDAVDAADWVPIDDERIDVSVVDDTGGDARPSDRQISPTGGDWGDSGTTMNQDEPEPTDEQHGERTWTNGRDEAGASDEGGQANGAEQTSDAEQPATGNKSNGDGPEDADEAEVLTRGGSASDTLASAPTDGSRGRTPAATDDTDPGVPTQPEPHDSVVERLAEELRGDEPSTQAVATLRSHLRPDTTGSVDAKLDHCMARIGELDAYVDALEAFLDEESTAEQLLAEVRDDLRTVEAHVEDVERRLDSVEAAQSRLDDRLASVESDLESVRDVEESVADLDATVTETRAELTDAVADVEEELTALADDLESVEEWRSTVVQALSAAEERPAAAGSGAG